MNALTDIIKDPAIQLITVMFVLLMLAEACFPARALPQVKYWKLKGVGAFILYFLVATWLPAFINPYLESYRLLDLSVLGNTWGAIAGLFIYEFALYVWHRSIHSADFLWRILHQMHHSAERVDTYGAFFFSPLDMIGFTVLSSVCFTLIAGFTPQAITIILLATSFFSIFQHANLKTPAWLGYFIQRPESHAWHHAQQVHRNNYADLPVFDLIFGTFHNPKDFPASTGFYPGASGRTTDMPLGRDIATREQ